jgi:hypothetical protein
LPRRPRAPCGTHIGAADLDNFHAKMPAASRYAAASPGLSLRDVMSA